MKVSVKFNYSFNKLSIKNIEIGFYFCKPREYCELYKHDGYEQLKLL